MGLTHKETRHEFTMNMIDKLWCGIADVVPAEGNDALGRATAAYVSVACLASSEGHFESLVAKELAVLGFRLFQLDEVRAVVDLSAMDPELREQVESLGPESPFAYGPFHSYRPALSDEGLQ